MVNEIVAAVQKAGIVGAGGAGFPTHVKLNAQAKLVIANGAECEPLLRAHQHIMAAESEKVILGLKAAMLATGAPKSIIGLKKKYTLAAQNLQAAIDASGAGQIELFFLPDFYPAGDEQVLVYEITGKIVPEGGIPLNVGVVVLNIETLLNVAQGLKGIPVTEKYVTVTGAVRNPMTLIVPIGTSVSELVSAAGGATITDYAVIDGGPMMGKIISPASYVTKTTGGIIVLPQSHPVVIDKTTPWASIARRAKSVCCSCRACTDSCPRYLLGHSIEPHRIMQAVGKGNAGGELVTTAFLCSECGACDTFACTMGLSPRRVNMELKKQLGQSGIKNAHRLQPLGSRSGREYRHIPIKRLISRLGLTDYNVDAPLLAKKIFPVEVRLPLSQHIGAPSVPQVKVGDTVSVGQLVASIPEGSAVSANLHASIDGVIFSVEKFIGIRPVR